MQPESANSGWAERNQLFHENYDKSKPFRKSGLTLFGRLMHELVSCETGVNPKLFLFVFIMRNLIYCFPRIWTREAKLSTYRPSKSVGNSVACAKAALGRVQMLEWRV